MTKAQWDNPVEIHLGGAGVRTVSSPFEALIYLTDRWPNRTGAGFLKAKAACKGALEGRVTAEEAHLAFVAAAEEVSIGGDAGTTSH